MDAIVLKKLQKPKSKTGNPAPARRLTRLQRPPIEIDVLKRKEEELRRFKFISDNACDAHDLIDEEGRLVYVNRRAWERLGYTEAEMLAMNLSDIDPLCSRKRLRELFQVVERLPPFESQRRRKDGSIFPVEVSMTRLMLDGKPHMHIVARNITDRKQAEEKLREAHDSLERRVGERTAELDRALNVLKTEMAERKRAEEALQASERRYRELFEKASDVIYTMDLEGNFTSINAAGEAILGYSRDEITLMNLAEITSPEQFAKALDVDERKPDDAGLQYETFMRARDGRWVPLEIRSRLIREKGRPVGTHSIGRDITERKRIEEERRELAVRLTRSQDDERRRLARELHDTTGQNLVALRMNLSLVRDRIARLDPKLQQALEESADLADQCIRELRTLSYLLHPPLLDERGLASAVRLYSEGFSDRSGIAVQLEVSEDFGRLPQEIELAGFRVVQECLTNVHRHSSSQEAHIRLVRDDSRVVLEVSADGDQGPGTTPAAMRDAEERGIGIRGMRERMRQLGGKLEIESKPSGMLVRAVLPLEPMDSQESQPLS
jgi:PAS domain S-box-containing protein